jgi:hypothetical protein
MKIVRKAAVVAIAGFLLGATLVPSWAAMPAANMAAPNQAEVIAAATGPFSATESLLEPSVALQATRQVRSNCKASHMYGADNLVGDPKACIMGGYGIAGAYGYGGVGMATGGR